MSDPSLRQIHRIQVTAATSSPPFLFSYNWPFTFAPEVSRRWSRPSGKKDVSETDTADEFMEKKFGQDEVAAASLQAACFMHTVKLIAAASPIPDIEDTANRRDTNHPLG